MAPPSQGSEFPANPRRCSEQIEGKLCDNDSAKWRGIFSEWLSEAQAKERDIEERIDRIRGWIRENEDKLFNL